MKHLNFKILLLSVLLTSKVYSQSIATECYSVNTVTNQTKIEGLNSKKYTFGIKQMTEEILSEKRSICENGIPVSVTIVSIEAPSEGINVGPFSFKKKTTEVKVQVKIGDKVLDGTGTSKLSTASTFLELNDENLPFMQTTFSTAVKKALIEAIEQLK